MAEENALYGRGVANNLDDGVAINLEENKEGDSNVLEPVLKISKQFLRKSYSVEFKLKAVERLEGGEMLKKVSKDTGVPKTSLAEWKRQKDALREFARTSKEKDKFERKKLRSGQYDEIEQFVMMWYRQQRHNGLAVSGPSLRSKAEWLAKEILGQGCDFKASKGWLQRFQKRHGINDLGVGNKEQRQVNSEVSVWTFVSHFRSVMDGNQLSMDQIFCADEFGIYYRALPSQAINDAAIYDPSVAGCKPVPDHVTFLVALNATGTCKVRPLCVGKQANRLGVHAADLDGLPITYHYNKCGWITNDLFLEWVKETFVPEVSSFLEEKNLPQRAILLVENCPAHANIQPIETPNGYILIMYLPQNVSPSMQPMAQGYIHALKQSYRHKLLEQGLQTKGRLPSFFNGISIKEAIHQMAECIEEQSPESIEACWYKALGTVLDQLAPAELSNQSSKIQGEIEKLLVEAKQSHKEEASALAEAWITADDHCATGKCVTEKDIIQEAAKRTSDNQPKKFRPPRPLPTVTDVIKSLETALRWFEQQEGVDNQIIICLRSLLSYAKEKRTMAKKSKRTTKVSNQEAGTSSSSLPLDGLSVEDQHLLGFAPDSSPPGGSRKRTRKRKETVLSVVQNQPLLVQDIVHLNMAPPSPTSADGLQQTFPTVWTSSHQANSFAMSHGIPFTTHLPVSATAPMSIV